jgi:hypothetical protein
MCGTCASQALLENNTTHFTNDELERLLAAFKRVTADRLSVRFVQALFVHRGAVYLAYLVYVDADYYRTILQP